MVTRKTVQDWNTERGPNDIIQPEIDFFEIESLFEWENIVYSTIDQFCTGSTTREYRTWRWNIVRKTPFSLEVLAAVKVATCGFNLETLGLPRRIEKEVKNFIKISLKQSNL